METILVFDSSGSRGSLNSLLLRAGYDVRSVTGGLTLSALVTSGRSSALFLRFQKDTIPTSAQATCLAIRQTDPDIPLIVLGPSADIATKVGLFKLGADDYIEEPLTQANWLPGCDHTFAGGRLARNVYTFELPFTHEVKTEILGRPI